MKLYLLKPDEKILDNEAISPWNPWCDKTFGIVVRAKDELEARELASTKSGDEGKEVWLDDKYTTCIELVTEGQSEVILVDFASA